MNARHSADTAASDPVDITFDTPGLTATEIAAVTAVITAAVREQASDEAQKPPLPSVWQRSLRTLRSPLTPGPGSWRNS